jgi:hypothetical protein
VHHACSQDRVSRNSPLTRQIRVSRRCTSFLAPTAMRLFTGAVGGDEGQTEVRLRRGGMVNCVGSPPRRTTRPGQCCWRLEGCDASGTTAAYDRRVAGYGTEITAPAACDELVRALMRAAQRRGKRVGLRIRYRRRPLTPDRSAWMLSADGSGVVIAAWAQQLERELPVVAEGFTGASAGATSVRVGRSLAARFVELSVGNDALAEIADTVTLSRDDVARVFWPILDPPDLGQPLADRLQLADRLIGRWIVGDLPDETGLEEIHTAIEIVLRTVLAAGRNARFPQLLDRAQACGMIDAAGRQALTRLNDHRRTVKHNGGVIPTADGEAVTADLWRAAGSLDRLQGRLDQIAAAS